MTHCVNRASGYDPAMPAPIPLVLALVAEADHPAGGALRERLAALGGEIRTGPSAMVISWEDSRGREEVAIRAARDAVKFARDAGLAARAAVHLGLPDPSPGAFAMARAAPDGAVWVSKAVERLVMAKDDMQKGKFKTLEE
ncbi:MAG: hypothetical protein FD180_3892, partial [Planctomycetota bacterium]